VLPTEAAQSGANAAVTGADPGESTSASAAHGGTAGAQVTATNRSTADAEADIDDAEAEQDGEQDGGEEQDTPCAESSMSSLRVQTQRHHLRSVTMDSHIADCIQQLSGLKTAAAAGLPTHPQLEAHPAIR
jgi:hypothetical protein